MECCAAASRPLNGYYFWERGGTAGSATYGDSDILVEALDDVSNVIASYQIHRQNYTPTGYNISTLVERPNPSDPPLLNNGPFNIGSIGISLQGASTRALRLTSSDNNKGPIGGTPPYSGDNGPDFKLIGAQQNVPGSMPLLGLGARLTLGAAAYVVELPIQENPINLLPP